MKNFKNNNAIKNVKRVAKGLAMQPAIIGVTYIAGMTTVGFTLIEVSDIVIDRTFAFGSAVIEVEKKAFGMV